MRRQGQIARQLQDSRYVPEIDQDGRRLTTGGHYRQRMRLSIPTFRAMPWDYNLGCTGHAQQSDQREESDG